MPHRCTNCDQSFPDGSKQMLSGCPNCGGNKFQYLPAGAMDDPPEEEPPEPPEPPGGSGLNGSVTEKVGRAATTVKDYVNQRRSDDDTIREPTASTDSPSAESASVESESSSAPSTADSASLSESSQSDAGPEASPASSPDPKPSAEPEPTSQPGPASPSTSKAEHESGPEPESEAEPAAASEPTSRSEPEPAPDAPSIDPDEGAEVQDEARSSEDMAQASARSDVADVSELHGESDSEASDSTAPPPETKGRVVKEPDTTDRPDLETLREELNSQFESIKIIEPGQYELNLMELYDREEHIIALQEDGKYIIEVPESWREDRQDESDE